MPYADRSQLENAFTSNEISNLEAGGRDVDDSLDRASQEADTYLATRYAVPLTADPLPEHLVTVVCDIARYRLYAGSADQEVKDRYAAAVSWLGKVSKGDVLLPGVPLMPQEGSNSPGGSPPRHGRVKSRFDDKWSGYGH